MAKLDWLKLEKQLLPKKCFLEALTLWRNYNITFRLVDVTKNVIEKTYVKEFLNLPKEIQMMYVFPCTICLGTVDPNLVAQLTKAKQL